MTDLFFIRSRVYDKTLACDVPVPGDKLGQSDGRNLTPAEGLPVGLFKLVLETMPGHRVVACNRSPGLYSASDLLHLIAGEPPGTPEPSKVYVLTSYLDEHSVVAIKPSVYAAKALAEKRNGAPMHWNAHNAHGVSWSAHGVERNSVSTQWFIEEFEVTP